MQGHYKSLYEEIFVAALSFVVISCSLSPTSKSAILAQHAATFLKQDGYSVDFIDLRTVTLPFCNGINNSAYAQPSVKDIHDRILKADGIILASPIHNFAVSASVKAGFRALRLVMACSIEILAVASLNFLTNTDLNCGDCSTTSSPRLPISMSFIPNLKKSIFLRLLR
ncbi:MAG: hypothetical protein B7Y76_04690 [Sphingobacteriia bacterium 35-40-5]|nr:MAG: hypothetical protein B7Y76_04690 [Sphingobacteriia bacterium 35-40-5]